MAARFLLVLFALSLGACAPQQAVVRVPVEVKVPVPVAIKPRPELMQPPTLEAFEFVAPSDPRVVRGLTSGARDALLHDLNVLRDREESWRAWAHNQKN